MIKFFNKNRKLTTGFTLVETLVAISIFTISLLSLMVILGKSISDTGYVKKKDIATYLAQEGIEYMRNMRDTYMLYSTSSTGWTSFNNNLTDASDCDGAFGCYFNADGLDFNDSTQPMIDVPLTACNNATCSNFPLLYNASTGEYGYSSGVNSGFTRKIWISQTANETKVFSTVFWNQGSGSYSIVFFESLFNWVE